MKCIRRESLWSGYWYDLPYDRSTMVGMVADGAKSVDAICDQFREGRVVRTDRFRYYVVESDEAPESKEPARLDLERWLRTHGLNRP